MYKDYLSEDFYSKEERINVRLSSTLFDQLKKHKKRTGMKMSEMVRRGVLLYLERYGH